MPQFLARAPAAFSSAMCPMPIETRPESMNQRDAIKRILERLTGDDSEAYLGFIPGLDVRNSDFANAYAVQSQQKVILTSRLVSALSDSSQLAFVIGHELGHIVLHHPQKTTEREEIEADRFGLKLLREAGFHSCEAPHALLAILAAMRDAPPTAVNGRIQAIRHALRGKCDESLVLNKLNP